MSQKQICLSCQKLFLIIDQEEKFLKENFWPLPTHCPDCRQARRMKLRNLRKFTKTFCDICHKEIIIAFDRKPEDIVYCKEDYLKWDESSDHLIE